MWNFKSQYDLLNDKQREAVDTIEGSLLVVAGPGTGKTQLLAMRVANILKQTDTSSSNILCLTFTNKAATNMRDRLFKLVGQESQGAVVRTFHSFAAEIINMYPEYFWNGAKMQTISEAAQIEIIQEILDKLPLDNPLASKFAGKYTLLSDIMNSLKLVKEAGLTPDKLKAILEGNLAYMSEIEKDFIEILDSPLSIKKLDTLQGRVKELPDQPIDKLVFPLLSLSTVIKEGLESAIQKDRELGKTTHTGVWKKYWIQTVAGKKGMFGEIKRVKWWLALSDLYGNYRSELHQRGYYDFSDMLVEVIVQLEQHPELLAEVQERFSYVLIDEFQDTNAAQLRFAHLVADHHSAENNPNLMAVGDDDQSIYKFNGAELSNMLSFTRNYPKAKLIVLEKNYRSTQEIINVSQKIAEQSSSRITDHLPEISKNLVAANKSIKKGNISHLSYSSREHQLSSVAKHIKQNFSPEEQIAVLARGHDSLRELSSILIRLGVPIRYEKQSNILDHEIVEQSIKLAKVVVAIENGDKDTVNVLLPKILEHPLWEIDSTKLWKLALANFSNPNWLESLKAHPDKKLSGLSDWLFWLASEAQYQPHVVCMEYILGLRQGKHFSSPIRDYFYKKELDYLQALSALQLLRSLIAEFSPSKIPTLADFVNFVDINQENGRIIADESPFVSSSQAVQLLTVHKAKGLEFDSVYIIDAVEDSWRPRRAGRRPPANLPLQPPGDDIDDYVRLMYVAATRAKSNLTVSSYYQNHIGEDVLPTPIIRNVIDAEKVLAGSNTAKIEILEESLRWPSLTRANEKEMLKARLETYNLSVTHLLNFLDVTKGGPLYFKERNLLRLPEAKTPQLAHGTAMHAALEEAQKMTNQTKFNLSQIQDRYKETLLKENLPSGESERWLKKGKEVIEHLFKELKFELLKGSLPEQELKDIKVGEAMLSGKLDRVDVAGDELIIADYKTGSPLSSFSTKNKALAVKAYKQKMQLIFYALLAQNSYRFKNYKNITGQMVYVEAESGKDLLRNYTPTPQDIENLEKLIQAVWPKIMEVDLPDTSKYSQDIDGILQFEQDLLSGKI